MLRVQVYSPLFAHPRAASVLGKPVGIVISKKQINVEMYLFF